MKHRPLRNRQSVYCPTCERYTDQSYGKRRGERHCWGCGNSFTLKQSREAEQLETEMARAKDILAMAHV